MNTTISEALATGLPVIATKHSGFPDQVVHGKNGYLANEADPADFAVQMLEYMRHPERWAPMSDAARAHALAHYDRKALIGRQIEHYRRIVPGVKKVAFVVGVFPVVSETFIINQIADLLDRGIDVEIYSYKKGDPLHVSDRFFEYRMKERTKILEMPLGWTERITSAVPKALRLFLSRPDSFRAIFDSRRFGVNARSGKMLFWTEPFAGMDADIVHCHFGTMAVRYLAARDMLKLKQPLVVTFYGFDASKVFREQGPDVYKGVIAAASQFFTMSNNMKERLLPYGFPAEKIEALPVSVDVEGFPFSRRTIREGETMHIVSVGRFVEKKGFDDLLRATKIVKNESPRPFLLHLVGGGPLEGELKALAKALDIEDVVRFEGFMKVQDVVKFLTTAHLFVQSSKAARDGDME